jgi:hypothetical protein
LLLLLLLLTEKLVGTACVIVEVFIRLAELAARRGQ